MTALTMGLAAETGMPESSILRTIRGAPTRYKVYSIRKRNGGWREIAQPAREVKELQRALRVLLLDRLPVHSAATAYQPGASIADNVQRHSHSGPILKMDFSEFFPSIKAADWRDYCERTGCLTDPEDVELTTWLLFRKPKGVVTMSLSIGAPTSPFLSNILMYDFDRRVTDELLRQRVIYTRYADDLTFSAPRTGYLTIVRRVVESTLKEMLHPRLSLNEKKTVYATKKYKRFVTGLIISNDERVTIGHDKKRLVRARVHRALHGRLGLFELSQLSGYLAFINAVEPDFIEVLKAKYGDEVMSRLTKDIPRQLRQDREDRG